MHISERVYQKSIVNLLHFTAEEPEAESGYWPAFVHRAVRAQIHNQEV